MRYRKGYKYKTCEGHKIEVPFDVEISPVPEYPAGNRFVFYKEGYLYIANGYAWNGASGIPDTKYTLYPSLIHDAWYQLIRERAVYMYTKTYADKWFGDLCHERGLNRLASDLLIVGLGVLGDRGTRELPTLHMD